MEINKELLDRVYAVYNFFMNKQNHVPLSAPPQHDAMSNDKISFNSDSNDNPFANMDLDEIESFIDKMLQEDNDNDSDEAFRKLLAETNITEDESESVAG